MTAPQDKVYDFEKKRNKIQKYDRETMLKTIRAMKRIAEIKKNRENVRTLCSARRPPAHHISRPSSRTG